MTAECPGCACTPTCAGCGCYGCYRPGCGCYQPLADSVRPRPADTPQPPPPRMAAVEKPPTWFEQVIHGRWLR